MKAKKIKAKIKDKAITTCGHCGQKFVYKDGDTVFYKGKPICECCYQDFYGYCDRCGKFECYDNMDLDTLGLGVICKDCVSKEDNLIRSK